MSARSWIIGGSLFAHAGLVFALGRIQEPKKFETTSIEVVDTAKDKPKPPPAKVETPPPEAPRQPRARAAKAPAAPEPVAQNQPPQNSSALSDLPDLGLELSGGGGPGGLAIPVGRGPRDAAPAPVKKTLAAAPVATPTEDLCAEPPAKPKLLNLPQPAYTDQARAAGIEGKVRVELTVDATGKVVDAKVLSGLGHGLDEAAVAAARAATFEGAVRCGKPTSATFTIAMRFSAS